MTNDEMLEIMRRFRHSNAEIYSIVQGGINSGNITPAPRRPAISFAAGGTNMCPNSDFAFSHLAATVADTEPATAGATNHQIYRVFFQDQDANISPTRVDDAPINPYSPIWDRVQGIVGMGAVDPLDPQQDIAIQFTNNWLVGNRTWYIRVAVALDGADPVPPGTKLYVGFWLKRSASEGWANGDNFAVTHRIIGVPGSREFNYKVIAKSDTGRTIESAILNVTNIPATLGGLPSDNKVLITYPGALGFTEFLVYREDVAAGRFDLITRDRNSSKLFAYDTGQSINRETQFPAGFPDDYRAYEDIAIDATDIAVGKTFHNFVIRVPANLDTSDVIKEGTYLRIGVLGPTTNDQQILIDTIWASESYNVWSPSPFDDYPSRPTTTMVTSYPGGGPVEDPPVTGTCVWEGHDLLVHDGWVKLSDVRDGELCLSGTSEPNDIRHFVDGETSQYCRVEFDCGLVILCTPIHRFIRNFEDSSGIMVKDLEEGQVLLGGHRGVDQPLTVVSIDIENGRGIKVRSPHMTMASPTRFFAVGDRISGYYVWNHNRKQD